MGLLDMNEEQSAGLLSFGMNMLANSGPSDKKRGFGEIFGTSGRQTMEQLAAAKKQKDADEYRKMQMSNMHAQEQQRLEQVAAGRAKQGRIDGIVSKYEADPAYKPTMGEMFAIDPNAAFKAMNPKLGDNAHGLDPKTARNPATGKLSYFVQDKQGQTHWLDAEPADNFRYVDGNDYRQPQTFNPRTGATAPVSAAPNPFPAQPMGGAPGMRQPSMPQPGMPQPGASAMPPAMEPEPAVDPRAPWGNIVSAKERDQMKSRVYEQESKRLDDLRKRIADGNATMTDLERFATLNQRTGTGGVIDRIPGPTFDADKLEMQSISARLAPAVREPGSGSSTNVDVAMFLQGLPGIDKEGSVNKNIRSQYGKQLSDAQEQLAFREQYLAERGHLSGVNEAFAESRKPGTTGLDVSKLTPQQRNALMAQDPNAFAQGVERFTTGKVSQGAAPKKSIQDYGYSDQAAVIKDARNAIMRNPAARAAIIKRLEENGITNHGLK